MTKPEMTTNKLPSTVPGKEKHMTAEEYLCQLYGVKSLDSRPHGCADAIKNGLTVKDIDWNLRLQRPYEFLETVEPKVELARREAWLKEPWRTKDELKGVEV